MGICIQKNLQNLETICSKEPEFQVDRNKHNMKSMAVWKITQNSCDYLEWPFVFHSTSSYILIIVGSSQVQGPILQQDRTSIELAQMLFGAQFLCLHLKIDKKIMLNNKEYDMSIYSFYGDSEQDELIARARLTYYTQLLQKYLQFGAGYFCLLLLNQSQPIALKNQLKQFIDFQSQQYSEAHSHVFFKQQLFGSRVSIKQAINQNINILCLSNFAHGFEKLPHIDIKQQKIKKQIKMSKKKELDESLPFACQITEIDIKGGSSKVPKLEAGNIDESNVLFQQLGMNGQTEQLNKMEQFLKGLYLGTEKVSKDYSTLNEKKVKIIVNCAASYCKNWFVNDINYIWIDIPDPTQSHTKQFNIQCLIYYVADLIGKCLAQHSGVLIHCTGYSPKFDYSGSRSAAILIGVLMSSLKISYDDAFSMVNKKWKIKIPSFLEKQLKDMQKRRKQKTKGFYVYSICSYSANFPKHIVAKYICQIQSIQNIQGIDDFEKHVFLCVGNSACKIMKGRLCENQDQYEKYAKQHLRLLTKYEGYNSQVIVESIQKTFRKQTKIQVKQQILHIPIKGKQKNAGFLRNQQVVLKYPILRPVWQKKKQDAFYFTIRQKPQGAEVMMNKGMKWIGYEQDKQNFFDKIISCYLGHIPHDKIFIMESEQDQSLFDSSQINI